jgi:hypothetical protein
VPISFAFITCMVSGPGVPRYVLASYQFSVVCSSLSPAGHQRSRFWLKIRYIATRSSGALARKRLPTNIELSIARRAKGLHAERQFPNLVADLGTKRTDSSLQILIPPPRLVPARRHPQQVARKVYVGTLRCNEKASRRRARQASFSRWRPRHGPRRAALLRLL